MRLKFSFFLRALWCYIHKRFREIDLGTNNQFHEFFRSLSVELGRGRNKVTCLILNPGVVLTDLSRPYHKSVPKDHLLTADQAAEKLMQIIDKTSNNETGHFYDVDGTRLPF